MYHGPLHIPYDNFITAVDQYSSYRNEISKSKYITHNLFWDRMQQ